MRSSYLRFVVASALLLGLGRPGQAAQFHVDHIGVTPSSPTDQDIVQLDIYGYLANSGSFIANTAAVVNGFDVTLTIDADNTGGITIPLTVPDTETFVLGMLAPGTYTITITGTQTEDAAPLEQHSFTVIGGPTVCDSLVIADVDWAPFSDTAIVVHVFNPTSELFDHPGFLLLADNGDTLAQETVNFFGIPAENWHTLTVHPGTVIPDGPFTGTLELWTGFYVELACSWQMDFDLCPSEPCSPMIITIQNYGTGSATGAFTWILSNAFTQVGVGIFTLTDQMQSASDTLCMPPGNYSLEIDPQQPPNNGQLQFGVNTGNWLLSGPIAPVVWSTPVPLSFPFYGPCTDPFQGMSELASDGLTLARTGEGALLARTDGNVLGAIRVYDAQGRSILSTVERTGLYTLSTSNWAPGLYVVRTVGTDRRVFTARWVVD